MRHPVRARRLAAAVFSRPDRRLRHQSRHREEADHAGGRGAGDRDGAGGGQGGRLLARPLSRRGAAGVRVEPRQGRWRRQGERPSLPWTFRVVDDPTVNAFALPGGFIYVTRGIMAHLNSEAELVSVLGHEIGHVTARHTVSQISKSQLATLGLVAGMIVSPELAQFGDLAQAGMQLMFLKFGRNDEQQADDLGLRYMTREDYDPREMVEVFSVLDRAGAGQRRGPPALVALHPSRARESRPAHPVPDPGPESPRDTRREARLSPAPGRHGVRREPARGVLRGRDVLPPRAAFPAPFPGRLEDAEPAAGGRRHQSAAGRDRRLDPGARDERRAGRERSSCASRGCGRRGRSGPRSTASRR